MRTITDDPRAALTGLVSLAVLGILGVGGILVVDGAMNGSWLEITGGVAVIAFPVWGIFQGARTIKQHLSEESYGT